ncbi:hypothetical protein C8Q75DRAFT_804667 [Abortiporus biennis]|nr:hypothetical protein C8Q75DRAFT_804667 [Abortiporus biennis]
MVETLYLTTQSITYASGLILHMASSPLKSIHLSVNLPQTTSHDVYIFCKALRSLKTRLVSRLGFSSNLHPNSISDSLQDFTVTTSTLSPLFDFRNMLSLDVSLDMTFDIDNKGMLPIAKAWPSLSSLSLCPPRAGDKPKTTLDCLISFAKYTPCLRYLTLPQLDPVPTQGAEDELQSISQHRNLKNITVSYWSPISRTQLFFKFISHLFGWPTLFADFAGIDEDAQENIAVVAGWKEFEKQYCRMVREKGVDVEGWKRIEPRYE